MRTRLVVALLLLWTAFPRAASENWPEWRGPGQQGHSAATGLPTVWSETQNVRWKTAIPGQGWSSPVIWGERVWFTTAMEEGRSLRALCVSKESGNILHDIEVFRVERPPRKNSYNSYASPSPVIEEGRVYVCFGAMGSACIDTKTAQVVWRNEELRVEHYEGPGATPIASARCIATRSGFFGRSASWTLSRSSWAFRTTSTRRVAATRKT